MVSESPEAKSGKMLRCAPCWFRLRYYHCCPVSDGRVRSLYAVEGDADPLDRDLVQPPVLQQKSSPMDHSVALRDGDLARAHVLLVLWPGRVRNRVGQRHAQVEFGRKRSPQDRKSTRLNSKSPCNLV